MARFPTLSKSTPSRQKTTHRSGITDGRRRPHFYSGPLAYWQYQNRILPESQATLHVGPPNFGPTKTILGLRDPTVLHNDISIHTSKTVADTQPRPALLQVGTIVNLSLCVQPTVIGNYSFHLVKLKLWGSCGRNPQRTFHNSSIAPKEDRTSFRQREVCHFPTVSTFAGLCS